MALCLSSAGWIRQGPDSQRAENTVGAAGKETNEYGWPSNDVAQALLDCRVNCTYTDWRVSYDTFKLGCLRRWSLVRISGSF